MAELEERAAQAVESALAAGASDAWATATRAREVGYSMRNGALEEVSDGTSKSLALRLFADGRYSTHGTTDLDPGRVTAFVKEAVALTRALQPDAHRAMPDPARFPDAQPALDLVDATVEELDRETRLAWCRAMDARVAGEAQVISATSSVGSATRTVAAASSNGFAGAYASTSVSFQCEVTLADGERRPEDSSWAVARHVDALPSAADVAGEALALARARLGAVKGETQRTTLVVAPRAAGRLVGRLLGPATGELVQQQRSFWGERLGQPSLSPALSVIDDPLRPRGLASRPFDREGHAAQPLPLIESGRFENLYVDTYYASKLGRAATTGSPSNRIVQPGARARDEIVAAVGHGIYVTEWLGGNVDSTTGDFSFGARGHRIEGGALGTPLAEMNLTGNLLELFAHLIEVGNDPWPYAATLAPTLAFEDADISGV